MINLTNKVVTNLVAALTVSVSLTSVLKAESLYTQQYQHNILSERVSHSFESTTSNLDLEQFTHRFYGEASSSAISKLNYAKSFNGKKIYLNLSNSDNENSHVVGLGWNNVTVSFLNGNSESFVRDAGAYTNAYRFGLHGGNSIGFKFHGAAIDTKLNQHLHAQFGFTELKSNSTHVEERSSQYFQLASDKAFGRLSLLDRGQQQIGYSVEAGYRFGDYDLAVQRIKTGTNKAFTRIKTRYSLNHATAVAFELSNVKDPLHFDESRYMGLFSITHQLNKPQESNYAYNYGDNASGKKKGSSNGLLIGLGAVAGVAMASSGSKSQDESPRINTERDTAFTVLNAINPVSVRENREHGGWIYRNQDNTYGSSNPVAGTNDSVFLPNPSSVVPAGSTLTASYHTHAAFDPRYDNENFSSTDIRGDVLLGIGGYLGTPGGAFKYHFNGSVQTLGRLAN